MHEHPLTKCVNKKAWNCDNCEAENEPKVISYYCYDCDYDLCESCFSSFKTNNN